MLGSIGFPEIVMILLVVLLLFGPKKLPEIAKLLGTTIREFKRTVNDAKASIQEELDKADISEDLINLKSDLNEISNIKDSLKDSIEKQLDVSELTEDIKLQDVKDKKMEKKVEKKKK